MTTRNAARSAGVPARITVAGMAADLYGSADERPPLVLLPGLTFDRRIGGQYSSIWPGSTRAARSCPWTSPGTGITSQLPHSWRSTSSG
jgi:hypothetical protein